VDNAHRASWRPPNGVRFRFEFRRIRARSGAWRPQYTPKLKKRTALLHKLKDVFRRFRSQPVSRVIELINPILRGWVNYFAVGHSSRCFSFVRHWVEMMIRRQMMRAETPGLRLGEVE
jgi:RNA-directed DNA polymerase